MMLRVSCFDRVGKEGVWDRWWLFVINYETMMRRGALNLGKVVR